MPVAESKSADHKVFVTIELPGEIARMLGPGSDQIARSLLEQAAVEGYRSQMYSRGQISRMLGLDWEETEEFLAKHECFRHYGLEDLEKDRKNLDAIMGPS